MSKPILSIIIPSYNVSKYVDEVLPTYIDERLFCSTKILIIDDGATDDTKEKVAKYIDKFPNYFEFIHKENGGHGSVINYGVHNVVKTKYFKVIDGDDWVDKDELCNLVNYLYKVDHDLVISDCSYEYKDHSSISYGIRKESNKLNLRIHNVTFKTSVFLENNIFVREKVFYEDSEYVLFPLRYVKTFSYFPGVVAKYRQDDPNQSVNPNVQLRRKQQYEIVALDLLDYANDIIADDSMLIDLKNFVIESVTRIVFGCFELNWSYQRSTKEAIIDCRRINKIYKKNKLIYKMLKKKYKRFNQMRLFGFNGIRIARLLHRNKNER